MTDDAEMVHEIDEWPCKQIPNGANPIVVCEKDAAFEAGVAAERARCAAIVRDHFHDHMPELLGHAARLVDAIESGEDTE